MKQHVIPCAQCPFRRDSAPGWLGSSTPQEFAAQAESDGLRMPCHIHIDYEQPDWEDEVENVPRCAGRAIYLRNRCKLPRDRDEAEFCRQVQADRVNVVCSPAEFFAHHGDAP